MKYLKHKDLTVILDFLTMDEIDILETYIGEAKWEESLGDEHFSNTITSPSVGQIAQGIRDRLKSTIEDNYACNLSDESLATFVKYRPGHGLRLHYDAVLVDDETGEEKIYKTFGGYPSIDISSTIYLGKQFTGGEIHFPRLDITYRPVCGSVIIFPSSMEYEHEVFPVTDGDRIMTSVFWHKLRDEKN